MSTRVAKKNTAVENETRKNAFVWVTLISKNVTRYSAPEKARATLKHVRIVRKKKLPDDSSQHLIKNFVPKSKVASIASLNQPAKRKSKQYHCLRRLYDDVDELKI